MKDINKIDFLFVEPILAHYRRDTYRFITNNHDFETLIIAGDSYDGIKPADNDKLLNSGYWQFKIFNHKFYYLKKFFKKFRKNKPQIIVCSGIDFHLIHTMLLFIYVKLFTRVKFIWWSQGSFGKQGKLGRLIRSYIYRNSDGILAYSDSARENLIGMGVNSQLVVSVGNAINMEDYGFNISSKGSYARDNEVCHILFTGRLTSAKRVDILLRALQFLKENSTKKFKCTIVGDGMIDNLKSLSKSLGVDNIVDFVGPKYDDEIVPYFQNADIYVFPGGIGLSIVHALSYGLPLITTDNFDLHYPEIELLKPSINGDTFQDNNPKDLAHKIELWSNKVLISKNEICKACIGAIDEKNYLPNKQAQIIIDFLSRYKVS